MCLPLADGWHSPEFVWLHRGEHAVLAKTAPSESMIAKLMLQRGSDLENRWAEK